MVRSSRGPGSHREWEAHLQGSPSLMELFRGFRRAGGPVAHHRLWTRQGSINLRHAHEHFTLSTVLELMCCFDQLNAPSLLSAELIGRRIQLIESAYEHSKDGRTPDFYHAEEMIGTSERASGAIIAPTLEKETAERLKDRAEIQKQLRKSKESLQGDSGTPNKPNKPNKANNNNQPPSGGGGG